MSEAQKVIDQLNKSGFKFYLGGSRRMAELHPDKVKITQRTDHDLYTTYSEAVEQYLLTVGNHDFCVSGDPATSPYPYDTEVVKIMQHTDMGMQIVLRKDAEFYRAVFEAIPPEYYTKYLWKSSPDCPDTSIIMPTFDAFFAIAHAQGGRSTFSTNTPVVRDPLKAYEYAMKGII
jgi:hypothetical protein